MVIHLIFEFFSSHIIRLLFHNFSKVFQICFFASNYSLSLTTSSNSRFPSFATFQPIICFQHLFILDIARHIHTTINMCIQCKTIARDFVGFIGNLMGQPVSFLDNEPANQGPCSLVRSRQIFTESIKTLFAKAANQQELIKNQDFWKGLVESMCLSFSCPFALSSSDMQTSLSFIPHMATAPAQRPIRMPPRKRPIPSSSQSSQENVVVVPGVAVASSPVDTAIDLSISGPSSHIKSLKHLPPIMRHKRRFQQAFGRNNKSPVINSDSAPQAPVPSASWAQPFFDAIDMIEARDQSPEIALPSTSNEVASSSGFSETRYQPVSPHSSPASANGFADQSGSSSSSDGAGNYLYGQQYLRYPSCRHLYWSFRQMKEQRPQENQANQVEPEEEEPEPEQQPPAQEVHSHSDDGYNSVENPDDHSGLQQQLRNAEILAPANEQNEYPNVFLHPQVVLFIENELAQFNSTPD